ncbi:vacuolar protein sorting-associated protein 37C [Pleurodeles waltl]|uniref:vacuolar protein sorting-associated protein 37C n=1 Tax=Pleurodeles waltl TaxID=8319 RepID=UPI0037096B2D
MESLQNMSVEELQKMQEDPERMDHLALESQELQSLQLEKETYLAMNRRLAEENLAFQPRLDTGRLLLQERYEALGEAVAQYKQQKAKLDSFAATVDPKLMLPTLQDQLRIIEEESDEMAEKFLEGLISLESFLEDFSSKRRLSHQRRVRVEKLQELLKMQETAPQPSMQQSESQTQPFIHPAPVPPLVDPPMILGPPASRSSPPCVLPYSPSPPLPDQSMLIGPVAHGNLVPAAFPGFMGPQSSQSSPQRTFPQGTTPGHPRPGGSSFSYPHPGTSNHSVGHPAPSYSPPVGPSYSYPRIGGPGYPLPGGPGYPLPGGPGYPPQRPPSGQPPYPTYSPASQSQCPYPTQIQRYPGPPQPPYPQYPSPSPGYPLQPSLPGSTGWPRYPTGQ